MFHAQWLLQLVMLTALVLKQGNMLLRLEGVEKEAFSLLDNVVEQHNGLACLPQV